jgi:hypothetical protein
MMLFVFQDEIIFPSLVAASYFRERNFKKKAYILASAAFKEIFESNDIICSSDVGVSINFVPLFLESVGCCMSHNRMGLRTLLQQ